MHCFPSFVYLVLLLLPAIDIRNDTFISKEIEQQKKRTKGDSLLFTCSAKVILPQVCRAVVWPEDDSFVTTQLKWLLAN